MSRVELEREEAVVAAAGVSDKLTTLMEKLLERMDRIERQTTSDRGRREPDRAAGKDPWRRPFTGECWRCGKTSPGTVLPCFLSEEAGKLDLPRAKSRVREEDN